MLLTIPNLLTYFRIAVIPALVGTFYLVGATGHWLALALFAVAGVTDFLDGYLARVMAQQSPLGRMLDPIADKLLVAAALLVLMANGTISDLTLPAAVVILCREIIVSGLREFLATLQVSMPVTRLAKWKTTFQLVSFGALILAGALPAMEWVRSVGLATLWGAAVLTMITGWDYLRVGLKHMD